MKQTFLILVAIVSLATFSCKKDKKNGNTNDNLPALDANKVTDWLQVEGATKRTGNPPAPNGATAPKITSIDSNVSGIVDEGFFGTFGTEGNYTGAYVKVKGADKYLEINLGSAATRKAKKHCNTKNQRTTEEEELDIFFGLSDSSEIGTFCYEICLFDGQGLVGNIVEVCVTINNVGGNNELVGKWRIIKQQLFQNGVLSQEVDINIDTSSHTCTSPIGGLDSFIIQRYTYIEFFADGRFVQDKNYYLIGSYYPDCLQSGNYFNQFNNQILDRGKWSFNSFSDYNGTTKNLNIYYYSACIDCGSSSELIYIWSPPRRDIYLSDNPFLESEKLQISLDRDILTIKPSLLVLSKTSSYIQNIYKKM
jgi:hypothetical protein